MKINIQIFEMLDKLAKSHHITDVQWAQAAIMRRPTIPELRQISRKAATGASSVGSKRACTLEKILKLSYGLSNIVGGTVVNLKLKVFIEGETDQNIRLLLLMLILQNAPKEQKDIAETLLKWPLSLLNYPFAGNILREQTSVA